MITKALIAALGALLIIAAGQTYRLSLKDTEIAALTAELHARSFQLRGCAGRLSNIIADMESDHAIELLPDSALTVVPPHWLQPLETN